MEDEDVILGNSPLDEYLQEVTDIPFSKYNVADDLKANKSSNQNCQDKHSIEILRGNFIKLSSFYKNDHKYVTDVLDSIILLCESNLLQEDDQTMVVDIRDEAVKKKQQRRHLQNHKVYDNSLITLSILILGIGIQYLNVHMLLILILLLLSVVAFYFVFIKTKTCHYQVQKLRKSVEKLVKQFIIFNQCIDKSIKHLKEVEVINHGIHVYNKKIPGTNITIGNTQKCLKLQNCLMDALIDLFTKTQCSTNHFIQHYSKHLFFYKEEFVSSLSKDNFGDVLTRDNSTSLELSIIPLSKLKTMVYLYRIILSEFLLSSIICIHSVLNEKLMSAELIAKIVSNINPLLETLENHHQDLKGTLQKSIENIFKKKDVQPDKIIVRQTASTDTLFNSCKLNIYSSLNRMEEIQSLLECDKASVDVVTFENLLLQFNLNLDNAKSCLEDIYSVYKPETNIASDSINSDIGKESLYNNKPPVPFVPPEKVGDLLLEGESIGEISKRTNYDDLEEFEKAAKESKESRRLLRELKTIFAVKESPVGLLKFPLQKVPAEGLDFEILDENDEKEKSKLQFYEQKHTSKIFTGDNENESESDSNYDEEPGVRIGLPAGFLNQLQTFKNSKLNEETFGSSSDEEAVVEAN